MNCLSELKKSVPLIAPKHFSAYTAEEYHAYVSSMYGLRQKGSKPKAGSGIQGLSISRTKKGVLSIRRNAKQRPFAYVLQEEINLFVKSVPGTSTAEVWNAFKAKKFLIAKNKAEAEEIYKNIKEIPWGATQQSQA